MVALHQFADAKGNTAYLKNLQTELRQLKSDGQFKSNGACCKCFPATMCVDADGHFTKACLSSMKNSAGLR